MERILVCGSEDEEAIVDGLKLSLGGVRPYEPAAGGGVIS